MARTSPRLDRLHRQGGIVIAKTSPRRDRHRQDIAKAGSSTSPKTGLSSPRLDRVVASTSPMLDRHVLNAYMLQTLTVPFPCRHTYSSGTVEVGCTGTVLGDGVQRLSRTVAAQFVGPVLVVRVGFFNLSNNGHYINSVKDQLALRSPALLVFLQPLSLTRLL